MGIFEDTFYRVIYILQYSTYVSLIRVLSLSSMCTHLLPWPTIGWNIIMLNSAEKQQYSVNCRMCHIPYSLHMRKYTNINLNQMMFTILSSPFAAPVQQANLENVLPMSIWRVLGALGYHHPYIMYAMYLVPISTKRKELITCMMQIQ